MSCEVNNGLDILLLKLVSCLSILSPSFIQLTGPWPGLAGRLATGAWLGLNGAGWSWPQFSHPGPSSVHWLFEGSAPQSVLPSLGRILGPGSSMRGEGVWTEEQGTGGARIFLCLLDLVSLSLVPLHGRKIRFEIFFPWDFPQLFFSRLSCLGNRCLECGCVVHGAESACSDLLAAF